MDFTSKDLILVCSTVIVGLLILMSFQATQSPLSISVIIEEKLEKLDELRTEFRINQKQLNEYELLLSSQIDPEILATIKNSTVDQREINKILENQMDPDEIELIKSSMPNLKVSLINLDSQIDVTTKEIEDIYANPEFVLHDNEKEFWIRAISIMMIAPFALAAGLETVNSRRGSEGVATQASRSNMEIMIGGFGLIVIGLVAILFLLEL